LDAENVAGLQGRGEVGGGVVQPDRKLHKAVSDSLADPELVKRFDLISATIATGSPDDFGRQIATEAAQWKTVVEKANLKIE
jgi:tripartite-type tricarboxylate transporter receptor subunit TctC